mmetsp:Transcript_55210/g.147840  ORF Transcript_55210/g.147840 Transcript_55210/m.147840 type:complete len:225 (+) Transcript_55210:674-1348(+)
MLSGTSTTTATGQHAARPSTGARPSMPARTRTRRSMASCRWLKRTKIAAIICSSRWLHGPRTPASPPAGGRTGARASTRRCARTAWGIRTASRSSCRGQAASDLGALRSSSSAPTPRCQPCTTTSTTTSTSKSAVRSTSCSSTPPRRGASAPSRRATPTTGMPCSTLSRSTAASSPARATSWPAAAWRQRWKLASTSTCLRIGGTTCRAAQAQATRSQAHGASA